MVYYGLLVIASLLFSGAFIYLWHKGASAALVYIFLLVPISTLAHWSLAACSTLDAALVAQRFIYIPGVLLPFIMALYSAELLDIQMPDAVRTLGFLVCVVVLALAMSVGYSDIYYSSVWIEERSGVTYLAKEYGPAHAVYRAYLLLTILVPLSLIASCFFDNRRRSYHTVIILLLLQLTSMVTYVGGRVLDTALDLTPLGLVISQLLMLLLMRRANLYNLSSTTSESMAAERSAGFVTFDKKKRLLGFDACAQGLIPQLQLLHVDKELPDGFALKGEFCELLDRVDAQVSATGRTGEGAMTEHVEARVEQGERVLLLECMALFLDHHRCGYTLTVRDDTERSRYLELLDSYNHQLEAEVAEKTRDVVELQRSLVLGMAEMVNGRDENTGGHIKRTSTLVSILVAWLRKTGFEGVDERFCSCLTQVAPMHDLGKIAIDDAILRKPGKLTDEELALMRSHASRGAEIVAQVMQGVKDEYLVSMAVDVAHCHHERWDGKGYPRSLVGEEIPLSARIMAIADVYDALVSKRAYKEGMPFPKAEAIMREGFGTQFDPALEPCFEACLPQLEAVYAMERS